ncbi:glycoside hydrolase family 43 protein [Zhouia sp. PK063]|uniref:glycoside hydrolase family 43 protein n=1 Tax=Zhouia sp. PK063 TaxID=3373602 RepID=UPI00379218B8
MADPTIYSDGTTYYLYGTKELEPDAPGQGFLVYTSTDLKTWEGPVGKHKKFALLKGDAFGDKGFWAPQILKYQQQYYIAYTANEHIALATSNSPLGPFTNTKKNDLKANVKQIDPFIFIDNDGKKYLYHVRLNNGNRIFVAELTDDLKIKPETLIECIHGEKHWENTANSSWPVTEGPTVIKHKGLYYLLYSANDYRNPDYAVGYATSTNPMGPWKKSDQSPIIHKSLLGYNGTGHGDLFIDKTGQLKYVFHTHFDETKAGPRKTAIVDIDFIPQPNGADILKINPKTFYFLKKANK